MDWYQNVFELIDMRSFSNLWFWIALAVLWSSTSHWVLGVPWDLVLRAKKRQTDESIADFEAMVRINVNRILYIAHETGLLLAAFVCFLMTVLLLLGFVYGNEFSQALFLLGFPMTLVGLITVRTARLIRRNELSGEALYVQMYRHRLVTQVIGVISIFVTAMWGMLQNMTLGVLGG
ncbi:component of SufBCD complex [Roseovarius sp. SYSU LYC5161]|uniref:component of SufBCD complex n=1 Tax=Roseovarius halophilus (ex Wu et al. 2025) TaxID=3376060 RepID=UPI002871266B|nr:component of SufBCD complex [Roseovarius sp.]